MNQTRVDDLLIEMIAPKVKEIEQKFSRAEGLTQEDINTLLLKSQYNHINHLDTRLNDVVSSVQALEGKFELLKTGLEAKFDRLELLVTQKLDASAARMDSFAATQDLKIERAINTNMRWSIGLIGLIVTVLKLADMFL
jgi:hypothetical protein